MSNEDTTTKNSPRLVPTKPIPLHLATEKRLERFWAKVDKGGEGGCWLWKGTINQGGYGEVSWSLDGGVRRYMKAHRLSYAIARGQPEPGLVTDHLCRVRRCVNPAHLEMVTETENNLRGVGAPAKHALKTHCPKGHSLESAENLRVSESRRGRRSCKICHKLLQRTYRARKKAEQSNTKVLDSPA